MKMLAMMGGGDQTEVREVKTSSVSAKVVTSSNTVPGTVTRDAGRDIHSSSRSEEGGVPRHS